MYSVIIILIPHCWNILIINVNKLRSRSWLKLTLVRVLREPRKQTTTSPRTNSSLRWDRVSGYSSITAVMMASSPPNWGKKAHKKPMNMQLYILQSRIDCFEISLSCCSTSLFIIFFNIQTTFRILCRSFQNLTYYWFLKTSKGKSLTLISLSSDIIVINFILNCCSFLRIFAYWIIISIFILSVFIYSKDSVMYRFSCTAKRKQDVCWLPWWQQSLWLLWWHVILTEPNLKTNVSL